ncbi:MAG: Histidine protein kinase DivJ [Planctomycetota bacterium]|jgi:signal transduction histidine kinase
MSYRSIKRVLGETSIERKCRLLFGACLLALIGGSFYWVDVVAERLVIKTTRSKARDLVDICLLRTHFEHWDTQGNDTFAKQVSQDFARTSHEFEVVALENSAQVTQLRKVRFPAEDWERENLQALSERFWSLSTAAERTDGQPPPYPLTPEEATQAGFQGEFDKALRDELDLYLERRLPAEDKYLYYTPIRWRPSCAHCHSTLFRAGVLSAADARPTAVDDVPFLVVKVELKYGETQDAINQSRAILIAVGILTVFVAMVALYIIVRYVVVKPLKHLRDVSDDISRGRMETRAEIRTGDEFQELADSFNRMLRHLTDTQANLRRVNVELDTKVDELAQLNMRLHEMNRLKGDFLANMSHELRTPLNSIIGFSEVLQGLEALNDKQRRYAQNIQKSGRVLLEMINDILDLAKVEAGRMDVRPTEFSIEALVQSQCDMVRSLAEEKNIDLLVNVVHDLPFLYQDQGKIQQILTNLLSNAIKFTPEGGRITVSARLDETSGRLVLTVADTGVGIAPEDCEIIFEKFRQGRAVVGEDVLTRRYNGTGLGLSIVRELCKLLGGEVSVESELGRGSTFQIIVPWNRGEPARFDSPFSGRLDDATRPAWTPPATTLAAATASAAGSAASTSAAATSSSFASAGVGAAVSSKTPQSPSSQE